MKKISILEGGVRVNRNDRRRRRRNIILAVLLGLLCISTAELAACSRFDPDTYERIVAPVRSAAAAAADAGAAALDAAGQFCVAAADKAAELAAAAARHTAELARQAALAWEAFTAPPPEPTPEATPPPKGSLPPASDPPVTTLLEEDGRQILTGNRWDVTYFCQSDEEWAEQLYGTDPIGPYGCGPTVMAMVVATMTDTETDPAVMAAWAAEHGYWARRSGSYHSIIRGTARAFGLEAESLAEWTPEALRQALRDGCLVVAQVGPGHFTSGGHFILIRGTTLSGDVLVADPNSLERSLVAWDPQIILDELSSARDNGAPLWALSVPDA